MISQFGMSEKLGPMEYNSRWRHLSSQTRSMIEEEVQKTLNMSYQRTKALLLSKRKELDLLAKALVDYETLDRDEVEKVIKGEKLEGRVPLPIGPMVVPKAPNALDAITGGDGGKPPPTAPPPPATVPSARDGRS
jgi:ATP-dependent metalloprotease